LLTIVKLKKYSYNLGAVYQTRRNQRIQKSGLISPIIFKTTLQVFLLLCNQHNCLGETPILTHP